MPALLDRLGVERPIVQAGMGGGLAGHELAGAVSGAGGLGTIGILPADALRQSIDAARERAEGRPIAVNLLLPFVRRAHLEVAGEADAVVTFWGRPGARAGPPSGGRANRARWSRAGAPRGDPPRASGSTSAARSRRRGRRG